MSATALGERPPEDADALALSELPDRARLRAAARERRLGAWGTTVTFSPKVFLPITNLCRDRCSYCTFRRDPGAPGAHTMAPEEITDVLARGHALGCTEALLCLGDRPETAFPAYRRTLAGFGQQSTVDYLVWASQAALAAGLFPHTNAGLLSSDELLRLRPSNPSLGLMLESTSERLCEAGMPHHRAPDKRPARRLAMIEDAGKLRIPFSTGILCGLGETPRERAEALLAIRRLHCAYGHIQEVIVQPFRPHPGTPMQAVPGITDQALLDVIALARVVLPDDVSVQSPPNLVDPESVVALVDAGANDLGGISPLTPDFINPRHPWPHTGTLAAALARAGATLRPRLPIYDAFLARPGFVDPALQASITHARRRMDETARPAAAQPEVHA